MQCNSCIIIYDPRENEQHPRDIFLRIFHAPQNCFKLSSLLLQKELSLSFSLLPLFFIYSSLFPSFCLSYLIFVFYLLLTLCRKKGVWRANNIFYNVTYYSWVPIYFWTLLFPFDILLAPKINSFLPTRLFVRLFRASSMKSQQQIWLDRSEPNFRSHYIHSFSQASIDLFVTLFRYNYWGYSCALHSTRHWLKRAHIVGLSWSGAYNDET